VKALLLTDEENKKLDKEGMGDVPGLKRRKLLVTHPKLRKHGVTKGASVMTKKTGVGYASRPGSNVSPNL
jgi:hypothetical protein